MMRRRRRTLKGPDQRRVNLKKELGKTRRFYSPSLPLRDPVSISPPGKTYPPRNSRWTWNRALREINMHARTHATWRHETNRLNVVVRLAPLVPLSPRRPLFLVIRTPFRSFLPHRLVLVSSNQARDSREASRPPTSKGRGSRDDGHETATRTWTGETTSRQSLNHTQGRTWFREKAGREDKSPGGGRDDAGASAPAYRPAGVERTPSSYPDDDRLPPPAGNLIIILRIMERVYNYYYHV